MEAVLIGSSWQETLQPAKTLMQQQSAVVSQVLQANSTSNNNSHTTSDHMSFPELWRNNSKNDNQLV
ncbi:unnamed protein product [Ceratitis capitata]|uniref:(Mediterranean fruit fly) hypothetical protein n=1 Tax=Ceratitis capitata TaxID=7213 RepID=A0A811U518_CERCA|nr:unnamed protein product [Ceratitis capitata]